MPLKERLVLGMLVHKIGNVQVFVNSQHSLGFKFREFDPKIRKVARKVKIISRGCVTQPHLNAILQTGWKPTFLRVQIQGIWPKNCIFQNNFSGNLRLWIMDYISSPMFRSLFFRCSVSIFPDHLNGRTYHFSDPRSTNLMSGSQYKIKYRG